MLLNPRRRADRRAFTATPYATRHPRRHGLRGPCMIRMMRKLLGRHRIELDEAWSFIGKKQRKVTPEDSASVGDQYVFLALADSAKAIISYRVGKRDAENTRAFVADLRHASLVLRRFRPMHSLHTRCGQSGLRATLPVWHYRKALHADIAIEAARRYSPGSVVSVSKRGGSRTADTHQHVLCRAPEFNLADATAALTRLTNAFSKKLDNDAAPSRLCCSLKSLPRP